MNRLHSGMSLIEVLVSLAILSILSIVILTIFDTTMSGAATTATDNNLNGRGRQTLDRIRKEIAFARIVECPGDPAVNHAWIGFRVPIDNAQNFGYWNQAGAGQVGWTARLTLDPESVVRETTSVALASPGLAEVRLPLNINRDNDTTDRYVICRLVLEVRDAAATLIYSAAVDDHLILSPTAANPLVLEGDVDNDGTIDPIFRLLDESGNEITSSAPANLVDGRQVEVKLFHGSPDSTGKAYLLRRNQDRIRLEQRQ